MEWSRLSLTALILFVPLALYRGTADAPFTGLEPLDRQREVARLRAHFDSVDAELRHADPSQLTPAQHRNRATLIRWLRDYREAGTFPRNDRFTVAMPFFRDSRGVLCAMAYLIDRSGRGDIVNRVALARNNAFIPQVAGDPELRAWLDSAGLSVAEAARIQPGYGPIDEVPEDDEVSANYALASILVSGASLTTVGLNLIAPSQATGWAGVIAGTAAVIAGAVNLDGTGGTDDVAAANIIVGGGALGVGVYRLLNPRSAQEVTGRSPQAGSPHRHVALSPVVIPTWSSPRLGLAVSASF